MLVKKFKSAFTPHGVAAIKKFNGCLITQAKAVVKIFYFSIFVGNPFRLLHKVVMPALNHEGSWKDEVRQLSVAECSSHIEYRYLPFHAVHKTAVEVGVDHFARVIA